MSTRAWSPAPLLIILAVALLFGCLGFYMGSSRWVKPQPCYRTAWTNDPFVNRALDLYGHGKVSREALRKSLEINVVHLERVTCVELNDALPGTADGGYITTCFDNSDLRVVNKNRSAIY